MQAFTCVGVASPVSSESLLPALWLGLVCSRWTISATVTETQIRFIQFKQYPVKTMNAISTVKRIFKFSSDYILCLISLGKAIVMQFCSRSISNVLRKYAEGTPYLSEQWMTQALRHKNKYKHTVQYSANGSNLRTISAVPQIRISRFPSKS